MKTLRLTYGTGLLVLTTIFTGTHPTNPLLLAAMAGPVTHSSPSPTADCGSMKGIDQLVCLADAFKATLSADQRATVQRDYSKSDATKWSNFPEFAERPRRVGIRLGSLNADQLKAAKALMAAVMSRHAANEGFDELEGNLAADEYLGKLIGKTETFNAGNYYLAYLGTPSATGLWELQFGGHHFAVANTYNGGKLTGVTPSFRGVEPIAPVTVNGRTCQSMEQERAAFAQMLGSLKNTQQDAARLSASFRDVLLGPGQDGRFPATRQGLNVGELGADQKKLVLNAIKLYVDDLDPTSVASVLASYTSDLDKTYIAFSGSGTMSQAGDYVRSTGRGSGSNTQGRTAATFPVRSIRIRSGATAPAIMAATERMSGFTLCNTGPRNNDCTTRHYDNLPNPCRNSVGDWPVCLRKNLAK